MRHTLQIVRPYDDLIVSVDGDNISVMINDHHIDWISKTVKYKNWRYCIIEVDGENRYLSRASIDGIGRRGGVMAKENTAIEVAEMLGIDVADLSDDGWMYH